MEQRSDAKQYNAMLEDVFRDAQKSFTSISAKDYAGMMYRRFVDGPYKARRKEALFIFSDRVKKDFGHLVHKGAKTSILDLFYRTELLPVNNYNLLDYWGAIRIGAAIWMLDVLARHNLMQKAWDNMIDGEDAFNKAEMHPYRIEHSYFPSSLIESMVLTLMLRYSGYKGSLNKFHFSSCIIPEESVLRKPLDSIYQEIIKLLPKEEIEEACQEFREKVWEVEGLALESQIYFLDRLTSFTESLDTKLNTTGFFSKAINQSNPKEKKQRLTKKERKALKQAEAKNFLPLQQNPLLQNPLAVPQISYDPIHFNETFGGIIGKVNIDGTRSYFDNTRDFATYKKEFEDAIYSFHDFLISNEEEIEQYHLPDRLKEKFNSFFVEDPFALCFALIYLSDIGDNYPWLMYSGGALMHYVYSLLPWYVKTDSAVKEVYGKKDEITSCLNDLDKTEVVNMKINEEDISSVIQEVKQVASQSNKFKILLCANGEHEVPLEDLETQLRLAIKDKTQKQVSIKLLTFDDEITENEKENDTQDNNQTKKIKQDKTEEASTEENTENSLSKFTFYDYMVNGTPLPQLMYRATGIALPYGTFNHADTIKQLLHGKCNDNMLFYLVSLANLLDLKGYSDEFSFLKYQDILKTMEGDENESETETVEETKQLEDVADELVRQQKENEKLKKALAGLRHKFKNLEETHEQSVKKTEKERRELYDLRELMFNMDNGLFNAADSEEEESGKEISYPYTLKKRMVIFGGHESFLKVMKQRFPNARFVDIRKIVFHPDLVRNSDVVWIQNNCLSHSQFWPAVRHAQQNDIQVRYFTFSGVGRCSQQLIEEDERIS